MSHNKSGDTKDADLEINSEDDGPVSSFQSYAAEGDILAKQGDFRKAIGAYSKALVLRATDKNVLVARSKCHLQLGDSQAALTDADSALKEDYDFFKGVFQKAEALYFKGDFEMALVFYHRGNKLRPEFDEFRLGIQKAREAISNSIGNPRNYKFQPPAGARLVITVPTGASTQSQTGGVISTGEWISPKPPAGTGFNNVSVKEPSKSDKTVKQLLGELYEDKEYLERFFNDKDFSNNPNEDVKGLVDNALKYLDTRTEFWRQQKPIYARKNVQSKELSKVINIRNRQLILSRAEDYQRRQMAETEFSQYPKATGGYRPKTAPASTVRNPTESTTNTPALPKPGSFSSHMQPTPQITKMVESSFEQIRQSMAKGEYEMALRKSKNLIARLGEIRRLAGKDRILGDVYNILGSIYMQLGDSSEAINYYRKELVAGKESKTIEIISRALGEIGRIYVKMRLYKDAIAAFEEKLVFSAKDSIERAWLLHDLGRCYLEIKNYAKAVSFGESCLASANSMNDSRWKLNAGVLVAQAQVQLKDFEGAIDCYSSALISARDLLDEAATQAINKALNDLKARHEPSKPIHHDVDIDQDKHLITCQHVIETHQIQHAVVI
ncbi:hypothetical protein O5D80_003756 [Batrachochytrium dendrobatidis]|nr:hypothetical protein O5D80_003756 [Batrachochytrium dendrobatidis]